MPVRTSAPGGWRAGPGARVGLPLTTTAPPTPHDCEPHLPSLWPVAFFGDNNAPPIPNGIAWPMAAAPAPDGRGVADIVRRILRGHGMPFRLASHGDARAGGCYRRARRAGKPAGYGADARKPGPRTLPRPFGRYVCSSQPVRNSRKHCHGDLLPTHPRHHTGRGRSHRSPREAVRLALHSPGNDARSDLACGAKVSALLRRQDLRFHYPTARAQVAIHDRPPMGGDGQGRARQPKLLTERQGHTRAIGIC